METSNDERERVVAMALSDTHGGHRLGLLNPDTILKKANDDGSTLCWTPEPTSTQRELWQGFTKDVALAVEFAAGDEIIAVHDGDVTQGDAHNHNIPETTLEDQREIAYWNLLPIAKLRNVKTMRLLTGTEVHGPESAEARVAHKLAQDTGKDIRAYNHERFRVRGTSVVFDASHHGPHPGTRDWLFGNVATMYLRDRIYRDRRLGKEPATVYLRGHYHHWVWITLNEEWQGVHREYHLVVLPSFCGLGEYARKATKSDPSLTIGMGLFEIMGGRLIQIKPLTETWDLRTEEEV
jgi:hypothetical protein